MSQDKAVVLREDSDLGSLTLAEIEEIARDEASYNRIIEHQRQKAIDAFRELQALSLLEEI